MVTTAVEVIVPYYMYRYRDLEDNGLFISMINEISPGGKPGVRDESRLGAT
jgi:hypothetical protein